MSTLGKMIDRIEDEIADTTLNYQVARSIYSAIEYYETIRWHFNEGQYSWSTSTGQEYYDPLTEAAPTMTKLPADIDTLRLTTNNNNYLLKKRDWSWMDQIQSNNSSQGDPVAWCWYKNQIRLWPIPDDTTSVLLMSAVVPPAGVTLSSTDSKSGTTATNVWFTTAERLIRYRAKADLYANVRREMNEASKFSAMEAAEYRKLRYDNANFTSKGRMTATQF